MIFYDFIFMIMTKTLMIILMVMGYPNNHQVVYVYVCLYSENISSCLIVGWWLVVDGDVNDVLLMIVRLTIVMMLTMQRAQAIRLGSSEAPARHKLIAN